MAKPLTRAPLDLCKRFLVILIESSMSPPLLSQEPEALVRFIKLFESLHVDRSHLVELDLSSSCRRGPRQRHQTSRSEVRGQIRRQIRGQSSESESAQTCQ